MKGKTDKKKEKKKKKKEKKQKNSNVTRIGKRKESNERRVK